MEDRAIQSTQAEMAVLSCLMYDRASYIDVAHFLRPEHFHIARAGQAWGAFLEMTNDSGTPDFQLWQRRCVDKGVCTDKDDILVEANRFFDVSKPPPSSIRQHAHDIIQLHRRRKYAYTGARMNEMARDMETAVDDVAQFAQNEPLEIELSTQQGEGARPASAILNVVLERIQKAADPNQVADFIDTGFTDLDDVLGGVESDDFVIVAGRPGMGKSSLLKDFAKNMVRDGAVLFHTLEMSAEQFMMRMACEVSYIPYSRMKRGQIHDHEWPMLLEAIGRLSNLPLFIDDTPGITPLQLSTSIRRTQARTGNALKATMVDYVQLMESHDRHNKVNEELASISKNLRQIALSKYSPALFAAAQLNRNVESRGDKRPLISDLSGTGSYEQDATTILLLYRDEYYNPDTTERPNIAEVDVAKNRNGRTERVDLYWNAELTTFKNLERQEINL